MKPFDKKKKVKPTVKPEKMNPEHENPKLGWIFIIFDRKAIMERSKYGHLWNLEVKNDNFSNA